MFNQRVYFSEGKWKTIAKAAFWIMAAVYLADCFSPLRFHYDNLRYFAIKDCKEYGCPPDSDAAKDYFPIGYTALLILLSKLHILKGFTLVLINSLYLFGGLWFVFQIFKKNISPYFFFAIVLLNWLMVKYTAHPLSEPQYIFFSGASIYFFFRFKVRKEFKWFLFSLIAGGLAFLTRTVGVTLICALVVGLLWEYKEQQITFFKKNKVLVIASLVVVIGALVFFSSFLGLNWYGNVLSEHFREAPFLKRLQWRFTEWGELFMNTPSNKIVMYLSGTPGLVLFVAVGLPVFLWFMYHLYFRKNGVPFYLKAYILFYCMIMFNWPFNDPRFWVPIIPLIAALIIQMPLQMNGLVKTLSTLLIIVYAGCGAFASGFMVYTSLDHKAFSKNQANGVYRNEYETFFFGKPLSDTATRPVDPWVMDVLKRYDR